MPYKLRKAPRKELYWVVDASGKKYSKEPLPKEKALAQMRALYANEKQGGSDCGCGGGTECITKTGGNVFSPKGIPHRAEDYTDYSSTNPIGFQSLTGKQRTIDEYDAYAKLRADAHNHTGDPIQNVKDMGKLVVFGATPDEKITDALKEQAQYTYDVKKQKLNTALGKGRRGAAGLTFTPSEGLSKAEIKALNDKVQKGQNIKTALKTVADVKMVDADVEKVGSGLTTSMKAYLMREYCREFPANKRKGQKLLQHLVDWIEKSLRKLDCGCGCKGKKKLAELALTGQSMPRHRVKRVLKQKRTGGKLNECPQGYKSNGAALCIEECNPGERSVGEECVKDCPPGWRTVGEECVEDCPPGWKTVGEECVKDCPPGTADTGFGTCIETGCGPNERDDGTGCWGDLKTTCQGDWRKAVWEPGHQVCHTNDGLLHHYHNSFAAERHWKSRQWRGRRWKKSHSQVDWKGTWEDVKKGMTDFLEGRVDLAALFDPEKNGVAAAFRKFGADTQKAFEAVGQKLLDAFDPDKNGLTNALKSVGKALFDASAKFGKFLVDTVGNEQWWKDTMSNPDTYILLIGLIATGAAIALSGGAAGPMAIAALNALGPAVKMIGDAAQGRKIDVTDIVGLTLSLVGGAAGAALAQGAVTGVMAVQALTYAQRAAQIGGIVVSITQVGQAIGVVPEACVVNCNTGANDSIPEQESECDVKKTQWKTRTDPFTKENNYADPPGFWTSDCPKPACDRKEYRAETGCPPAGSNPPTSKPVATPEEKYRRAIMNWVDAEGKDEEMIPKFTWTPEFPKPSCDWTDISVKQRRCFLNQEERLAEAAQIAKEKAEAAEKEADDPEDADELEPDTVCDAELGKEFDEDDGAGNMISLRFFTQGQCENQIRGIWRSHPDHPKYGYCYANEDQKEFAEQGNWSWQCSGEKLRRKEIEDEREYKQAVYEENRDRIAQLGPKQQAFFDNFGIPAEDWGSLSDEEKEQVLKEQSSEKSIEEADEMAVDAEDEDPRPPEEVAEEKKRNDEESEKRGPQQQEFYVASGVLPEKWFSMSDEEREKTAKRAGTDVDALNEMLEGAMEEYQEFDVARAAEQQEEFEEQQRKEAEEAERKTMEEAEQQRAYQIYMESMGEPNKEVEGRRSREEPTSEASGPNARQRFMSQFGASPEDFMGLTHEDMSTVAEQHGMSHEDAMGFAQTAIQGGGRVRKSSRRRQMKQQGLAESQRPGASHIRALQRRRVMNQTVKILPAKYRPTLLHDGQRVGGDMPAPENMEWYYPKAEFSQGAQSAADSSVEAIGRQEQSGFAGSGHCYKAAF